MITVKFDGLDFINGLMDIVRLFFKNDEICIEICDPLQNGKGLILSGAFKFTGSKYVYELLLAGNGAGDTVITEAASGCTDEWSPAEIKSFKWELKRGLYLMLSKASGKTQPWGMLTGIRPSKILHELLASGMTEDAVHEKLEKYYMIEPDKAELLFSIASAERRILDGTPVDRAGLYIGIPFCNSRCLYCSFTSNLISRHESEVEPYLDALKLELSCTARLIKKRGEKLQSIYIGGGTPTSLNAVQIGSLLAYIENELDLSCLEEFTIEAGRPDSINEAKLSAIKSSAVGRISINPQSMNRQTLELIGRSHSPEDVVGKFKLARAMGFNNINMDVIIGLPGETAEMFEHTLEELSVLLPDSLTVHTMSMKRASRLNEEKTGYELMDSRIAADMIDLAAAYAKRMGMKPYYLYRQKNMLGNLENIGYCKPGLEGIYNVQIMEEKQSIYAVGAGAASKAYGPSENCLKRAYNVKDIKHYISRIDEMIARKNELFG